MLTLFQFECFIAVAKYLNFTMAAESLFISQPSISKQISLLESELGSQRFQRNKKNVSITPAGQVLYENISEYFKLLENSIAKAKQASIGHLGTLRIGYMETITPNEVFIKFYGNLSRSYPELEVVLVRNTFSKLREDLLDDKLDLIFTLSFDVENLADIATCKLYRCKDFCAMSKNHRFAQRDFLSIEELQNENFVSISQSTSMIGYTRIIRICRNKGFYPKIVKTADTLDTLLLNVAVDEGVALLTNYDRNNGNPYIAFVPTDITDDNYGICVWKKNNSNPAVALAKVCLRKYELNENNLSPDPDKNPMSGDIQLD